MNRVRNGSGVRYSRTHSWIVALVTGARVAYAHFDSYVSREGAAPSFTAGPDHSRG